MRRARRLLGGTALLCAAIAGAAPAITVDGWTVQHVAHDAARFSPVSLAGNQHGAAVLAWLARGRIRFAVARAGHRFDHALTAPHSKDASDPRVSMNEHGDTLFYWSYWDHTYRAPPYTRDFDCCFGVRLTVLDHHGRFHRVQTLTRRGKDVRVDGSHFGDDGRIGIVWREYRDDTYYPIGPLLGRFSGPSGRLGRKVRIDRYSDGAALAYVDGRPRVLMVAYRGGDSALMERSMDARGRWRPRRLVAGGLPKDIYILLADVNRSGDEVVAWQAFSETGPEPIFAGVRGAGGPFEARRLAPGPNSFDPRVAIGPSGSAVVAWEQGDRGLRASVGAPGHPFTQPSFLVQPKPGPNGVEGVELAVDRHGRVLLAWKGWRNGHASVLAALRTRRGGVLHYARLVDSDDASVDGQGTAVLDGRARAIVAWRRNNRITAARAFAP